MLDYTYIHVERLHKDVDMPDYKTAGSSGMDVQAYTPEGVIVIEPLHGKLIPTGLRVAIPEGFELQVRPRSGLALKYNVTVLNTPGTIDSDYRGELMVFLFNFGDKPFEVVHDMRIAQLVCARISWIYWIEQHVLPIDTARGEGGYGSTGLMKEEK